MRAFGKQRNGKAIGRQAQAASAEKLFQKRDIGDVLFIEQFCLKTAGEETFLHQVF